MAKYDKEYEEYKREVQSYLKKVKGGRRVPAVDPQDPKFSQQADDERQARRSGLGSHIKFGPPSPAFNDTAPPPTGSINSASTAQSAPSPGMYDQFVDFLDRTRGALTRQFGSNRGAAPTPVWGFHEPTHTMAEGIGPLGSAAGDVMSDPRNAWMGFGPLAAVSRPAGWGAEVLRRYKLLGGTPETLNKTLQMRALDPGMRGNVVRNFKAATDIAAPPNAIFNQESSMREAGHHYTRIPEFSEMYGDKEPWMLRDRSDWIGSAEDANQVIESGTKGQAAYDAVSRQAGRVMDSPEFGFRRPKYGPEVVPDPATPERGAGSYWRQREVDQRRASGMAPPEQESGWRPMSETFRSAIEDYNRRTGR